MQKKLTKGDQSHYEIELIVSKEDFEKAKQKIMKDFQKDLDLPGFRKGKAPMDKVEENIKPEYLTIGSFEHMVNLGLQEIVKENEKLRFVGEPYGIDQKKEGDDTIITIKLDVFPEVEVINDDRKKHTMKKVDITVTQEEIDEAMLRLKKGHADYKEVDTIAEDTVSKIALTYLDKDGKEVDKGHTYVGEQEYTEDPFFKKEFIGKKKDETFELAYDEKKLPTVLLNKKTDLKGKIDKLKLEVKDVRQVVLPEITPEIIEKLFGKDAQVKNEKELLGFIETSITDQKFEADLMKQVEELLNLVRGTNMKIAIPQTLIEEEFKSRSASLEQRFGGKEKVEQYFKQIGEEKAKAFTDDIKKAAGESLEKFFILQKLVTLLGLDVNREKPARLEIEKKLYAKLSSDKGGVTSDVVEEKKVKKKEDKKEEKK